MITLVLFNIVSNIIYLNGKLFLKCVLYESIVGLYFLWNKIYSYNIIMLVMLLNILHGGKSGSKWMRLINSHKTNTQPQGPVNVADL